MKKLNAVEFVLPRNKPESVFYFLLLLDAFIVQTKNKPKENDSYTLIQLSQQSILSCFDDLLLAPFGKTHVSVCIENEMPISIEEFISKPGTWQQPDSVANYLFAALMKIDLPAYSELQVYFKEFYVNYGLDSMFHLSKTLSLMYSVWTNYISEGVDKNTTLPILDELEQLLVNEKHVEILQPFITGFTDRMRACGVNISAINLRAKLDKVEHAEPAIAPLLDYEKMLLGTSRHPFLANYKKANVAACPAFTVLRNAGIDSEAAYQLLQANKHCEVILPIMQKGGLFTANVAKNKNIFAHLIHLSQYFLNPEPDDPRIIKRKTTDSIATLVQLYLALAGKSDQTCYLTPKVNQVIYGLTYTDKLGSLARLLEQLTPLNQAMVTQIFSAPMSYLHFWDMAQKWEQPLENFRVLFKSAMRAEDIINCHRQLSASKPWLNGLTFKLILENITECKHIVTGFDCLHHTGLMASHKERFLQNVAIAKAFTVLAEIRQDKPKYIILAMEQSSIYSAALAVRTCARLGVVYPDVHGRLFKLLLANEEMISIIRHLCAEGTEFQNLVNNDFKPKCADIKLLLISSGLPFASQQNFDAPHLTYANALTLFTPMKLDACIAHLRKKYQINDANMALKKLN